MTFDPARFSDKLAREMPDAVIYADGEGIIQFWNYGAERIFGYAEREALGQSLDIIVPENLRQRHWMGSPKDDADGRDAVRRERPARCAGDREGWHAHIGRVYDSAIS